jgi:hypothetical protein
MRLRITFAKNGPLTYTSHLDLARIWERSLRRAGAPLAYSQGYNPRPKLQLAAALPLGHTAGAELLDVWLVQAVAIEAFAKALVPALPTQVVAAEYRVTVEGNGAGGEVQARIEQVLAADELPHERRGKSYDLRPLIERLWFERASAGTLVMGMQLASRSGATGRPEAVLEMLGMGQAFARYHRCQLLLKRVVLDGSGAEEAI